MGSFNDDPAVPVRETAHMDGRPRSGDGGHTSRASADTPDTVPIVRRTGIERRWSP
jgi:hypothetical protein